ncbi:MAG: hypothetical protein NTV36_02990 [Candidatus Staskawiczbacteria bacterium]|nr:hypothetical protein [Candidatus Staskawiczbacteria bacterium]
MANGIYQKRVIFKRGKQSNFLLAKVKKLNISWAIFSNKINVNIRTLNDWKREKYSMPIDEVKKICELSNSKMPKNDQKIGCLKDPLPIKIPKFSKDLAEFTGIMLGDGGISANQVKITTNMIDDAQYAIFIKNLIKKLFDLKPSVCPRKKDVSALDIIISRIKLVEFCNQKLGLHIGNKLKQGLDIPAWIRKNSEFEKACVRGLIDTDGCVFDECHDIKGKKYNYKRLNFTSASPELIKSVFEILEKNGLSPKIKNSRQVNIENKENIKKYFKIVGTSNPKHLNRYKK